MHEVGVNRASDELTIVLSEMWCFIVELANFGRAHKGEIKWPEKEHDILASKLSEIYLLELRLVPSCSLEVRSRLAYYCLNFLLLCH